MYDLGEQSVQLLHDQTIVFRGPSWAPGWIVSAAYKICCSPSSRLNAREHASAYFSSMEPSRGVSETMNGALTTAEPVAPWEQCTLVWVDGVPHLRLAESCPLVAPLLARPPLSSLGRRERIELDPALRTLKYGGPGARPTPTGCQMAPRPGGSIGA